MTALSRSLSPVAGVAAILMGASPVIAGEPIRGDLLARNFVVAFEAAAHTMGRVSVARDAGCQTEAETICQLSAEGGIRVVARARGEGKALDRVAVQLTEDQETADFLRAVDAVMLMLDPSLPPAARTVLAAEMMERYRRGALDTEVEGTNARYRILRLDSGVWMIAEAL